MSEILGCGIDIEELNRFEKHIPMQAGHPGLVKLVYTEAEINCNNQTVPHLTFPIGFSCKEACFKALGVSWTNSRISWKDIEILFNNKNDIRDYTIRLNGYALALFHEIKCGRIESHLELTDDYIIFQIILHP